MLSAWPSQSMAERSEGTAFAAAVQREMPANGERPTSGGRTQIATRSETRAAKSATRCAQRGKCIRVRHGGRGGGHISGGRAMAASRPNGEYPA